MNVDGTPLDGKTYYMQNKTRAFLQKKWMAEEKIKLTSGSKES